MEKLPIEIKTKWIEALRSGEYKQGKGFLYNSGSNDFCCIGILGLVCGISLDKMGARQFLTIDEFKDQELLDKIPKIMQGDNSKDGDNYSVSADWLSDMNDTEDKSFEQIADYIEENL